MELKSRQELVARSFALHAIFNWTHLENVQDVLNYNIPQLKPENLAAAPAHR
jgi:hypothetical protein